MIINVLKDRSSFVFGGQAVGLFLYAAGVEGICRVIQKAVTREQSDHHVDSSYGSHFVKRHQSDSSCAIKMAELFYNGFCKSSK